MSSIISELRKKPHIQSQTPLPVLLTFEYSEYIEKIIQHALNGNIILCCRIDIISANGIKVSDDFPLSPAQITQVWQVKPTPTTLSFELRPKHFGYIEDSNIKTDVGINGLYVNKIEADYLISLINEDELFDNEPDNNYRNNAISNAVINHILPELMPRKLKILTKRELNKLKFICFKKLPSTLEKDGHQAKFHKMNKKDDCWIVGKEKDGTTIHTKYEAFRKRFDNLFNSYLKN